MTIEESFRHGRYWQDAGNVSKTEPSRNLKLECYLMFQNNNNHNKILK